MTDTTPLIDAHAHLHDPRLLPDLDRILETAQQKGVTHILVNATSPQDWKQVTELSRRQLCQAALGLHPFDIQQWRDTLIQDLRQALAQPPPGTKIVAIGEIGLDAWNGRQDLPLQLEAMAAQLQLAQELKLPVCLHIRKAWNDFFQLLKDLNIRQLPGLCHNFTGSPDILREVLKLGLKVSFGSPAANPRARKIRQAIQAAPLEAILTETDCPNLPPPDTAVSLPHDVERILPVIADLKGLPIPQLAQQIQQNYMVMLRQPQV